MKIDIKVDTRTYRDDTLERIRKAVAVSGVNVESGAKENINRKNIIETGALEGSIQQDGIKRYERKVGNQDYSFYGRFHEFGTRYLKARPFLRPAADAERPKFVETIMRILES